MVSIVVTTFNYAHYLEETLGSVRDQIFQNWECIVVDGGSTDNTKELMNRIVSGDRRFSYIFRGNMGVSASRNTGIKISRGEFIQFLDGDDLLQKNKISSQLNAFNKKPDADIVYSDVRFFDDGKPNILRSSLKGNKPDDWLPKISGRGEVVLTYLKKFNFLVTHSPLIRRSVIDSVRLFDENMQALEDWDFWLRCTENNFYFHFHSEANGLAIVRVHTGSLSGKRELMLNGNFALLQKRISEKSKFKYSLYYLFKFIELYWDTLFSSFRQPKISVGLTLFSILFFPLWILIKIARMLKVIG